MDSAFVNELTYKAYFMIEKKLDGGGQGEAYIARPKSGGNAVFLKVLKSQNDAERRARFAREAMAYNTLNHEGIPKLIRSNALHHLDASYKLFMATDLIEGADMADCISAPVQISDAINSIERLIDIVAYLHKEQHIHRDIKPKNIVLSGGDLMRPVLVDLGLVFRPEEEASHYTDVGQEIGNRFLRLPELAAGSLRKQDPASDIALVAGILLFLLTNIEPSITVDEGGKMPHQRAAIRAQLAASCDENQVARLLSVFDKAFMYRPDERYQTTADLRSALDGVLSGKVSNADDGSAGVEAIVARLREPSEQRRARYMRACEDVASLAMRMMEEIAARLAPKYVRRQTGYAVFEIGAKNTVGLALSSNHDINFVVTVEAHVIGAEIVVSVGSVPCYRGEADAFDVASLRGALTPIFQRAVVDFDGRQTTSGI